jgi:hypothetical protein
MCQAFDDTVNNLGPNQRVDSIIDFIEESFIRFMGPQQHYSFFDETASLIPKGQSADSLSCILVTFARQWQYNRRSVNDSRLCEWLCNFLFRLAIIGENAAAIVELIKNLDNEGGQDEINDFAQLLEDIQYWAQRGNERPDPCSVASKR